MVKIRFRATAFWVFVVFFHWIEFKNVTKAIKIMDVATILWILSVDLDS